MIQPQQLFFAANNLDRMEHLRPNVLERLAGAEANNRFLVVRGQGIIVGQENRRYLFADPDLPKNLRDKKQAVFLGVRDDTYYFGLPGESEPGPGFEQVELRAFITGGLLADEDSGLIAQAVGLVNWHDTHQFCANCGAKTQVTLAGWCRNCNSCGGRHFPRVDPVVIMLVTHQDHCLLGSGRNFKTPGLYSCLAGFMEPGETIEEAARRELFEEAGIKAGPVEYLFSQPWPFPSNLMIGLRLEAQSKNFKMDEKELADLKWVAKAEVRAMLNGAGDFGFNLPTRVAIARNLLEVWVSS